MERNGIKVIGVDLDGTLCSDRYKSGGVLNCKLLPGAKEFIDAIHAKGYEVLLFTHRGEGLRLDTLIWLKDNDIEYEDIVFEKPYMTWYIGDEAIHFEAWDKIKVEDL